MLLQRLKDYADECMQLPPPLYSETPIRYVIELNEDGTPRSRIPTDTSDPKDPRAKRGQRRLAPQVQRANVIRPLLLADKADYTLGMGGEGAKPERVAACHVAYLDLLQRCADATDEPDVQAIQQFLGDDPASQLELPEDFDTSGLITFSVWRGYAASFPIDLPSVRAFWFSVNDPDAKGDASRMQCLICGQERPVLERLQGKIKGVPGGQTAGTAIISANAAAFESYGLEASLIAPTCGDCGEKFTKAANELIASEQNRIILGGAAFIFWTRQPVPAFSFRSFLTEPKPEEVRDLLRTLRSGGLPPAVDATKFYATVLSSSGGRCVVRDWIDTTVGEAAAHLAAWFERQRIVDAFGAEPPPLGVYRLAGATVRELKDVAPTTPRALLEAALDGTPVPASLLFQAVRRNRAEQRVTHPRAALIKLVLLSQRHDSELQEGEMVRLDPAHPNAAYHCGRLLAVLEEVQRLALPGIKATIVDRFFGTASSAPGSVFGRLVRGAQPHLGRLDRDRHGAYLALQRRLEEVQGALDGYPRVLNLEEQGLFALGYYHQRAFDREQARLAAERRRAGQAVSAAEAAYAEAVIDAEESNGE
ncbi:MAG TPA: type I-C CRISPR-associated protein Cas8c/Csd1 [Dehalococcoidia bacterium]|nr:type I-C CRISPR-associated protein Cas8c/Csd1 [Dehalococcoidia bacterium]